MKQPIHGAGLGLRRGMLNEMSQLTPDQVDFFEVAPENWMGLGGRFGKQFKALTERFPFACHGLSLSIGSLDPLDVDFVKQVKQFLDEHSIETYSEHLSYCSHDGHMYDLMPIPFTHEAVDHVVLRIKQVQDILERPLILENTSTYVRFGDLTELEFTQEVLEQSGCKMLLDVNNVFVNSINHGFDPLSYISQLPTQKIEYIHIAGHFDEADDLKVDTHGAPVKQDVWQLLEHAYACHGMRPTLLERDFNFPPMAELLEEVEHIRGYQYAVC
ncbi:DUF692 domain-containing protein [Bermanella sp. R86510]|uniref:HvfB family MNIO-type RiPP peptide maturase n=1 Tax=unclassified Bermanella TaxID=2627862 RepID=UPI0037C92E82